MTLVNKDYLHYTDIKRIFKILLLRDNPPPPPPKKKKKKKIGNGLLKNSGE